MKQSIQIIFFFLILMWGVYFASQIFPLQQFGIVPRTVFGLSGIVFSPFLHGSFAHLLGNSISFTIFGVVLAMLEGKKMFSKVILMVLIGGTLTWALGREANHIGASGLIFSLWGYMLLAGWYSRKIKYMLVSLLLIFFYSGMIFGIFPGKTHISWESHLFGFIAGILVSRIFHKK